MHLTYRSSSVYRGVLDACRSPFFKCLSSCLNIIVESSFMASTANASRIFTLGTKLSSITLETYSDKGVVILRSKTLLFFALAFGFETHLVGFKLSRLGPCSIVYPSLHHRHGTS